MKKMFKLSSTKKVLTIVVNKLKKNKKKIVIGLSVFLVVFISVFLLINLRYPTKINAYIAHVINKGEPANSYFDDEVFYKAIVDAYNKENKTSLPYTTNLTDEQLSIITTLSYNGNGKQNSEKIGSAKGIEKLTALTFLALGCNKLSNIDLSNNTALIHLNLFENDLSSINLNKNTKLRHLELDCNNSSSIDLSENIDLTYLMLSRNNLSNIDLSKNTSLEYLSLYDNNISSIDLSKNTALTSLRLGNNKISSIDLSHNTTLTSLYLSENNLNSIKLYDNFDISKLRDAIKNQNTYQTNLDLGSNRIINLTKDYKYYYSSKMVIPSEVDIQTFIDNFGLQNLTAKVFNNDEEISNGKVKEGYILKLYYEDIEIDSVPIKIFENSAFNDGVFYKAIVDAYNKENNTSLPYTTNLTDEQLSSIKSVSYSGFKKSDSEKIKSATGIEKLTSLTSLDLSDNNLSNVDLSKNTALTELNLGSNNISNIDLSNNTAIKKMHLFFNRISSIDLSHNTSLTELQLYHNNLCNIDLSKNTFLKSLYLHNNNLNSIDLSQNTKLTFLNLGYNNISNIDLIKNTNLTSLWLESNNISSVDLSKNTKLTYLGLYSNNLSNIDLSKNTELTILELYNNPLKLNAYVRENGTLTNSSIKMPEGSNKFYLTYEIEDNSIANFTDNKLNGLKVGKTNVTVTLNGVKASSSSTENMKIDGTITVFDRLKGDINNDDKITIADVSLLYRYVRGTKVIEDSKTLEVSDLTGDDKITIADVAKLYRYVRGKITELWES